MAETLSAASRLCNACGMCCDGTLFHYVRLQPRDSAPALAALGLKLKRKRKHDHIIQPCPAYRDSKCSIYLDRPERCRLFECRQIKRVASDEITEADAAAKIREALDRRAEIRELFERCGESKPKGPLSVRFQKIEAEPQSGHGPETEALRLRLKREMGEFEALLDANFRIDLEQPSESQNGAEPQGTQ